MKTIKADLHNHFTTKSRVLDVNRVADRVYESLGKGGICALVNYEDKRFEAFAERAEPFGNRLGNAVYFPDRDVLVLKGEEIPTLDGDLLVLGLEEGAHLTSAKPLHYTMDEGKEKGGIIVVTSPYFMSETGDFLERFPFCIRHADAIETHNGNATKRANRKAEELHESGVRNGYVLLGKIAVSDGHSFREVGSSYTEFFVETKPEYSNSKDVVSQIRGLVRAADRELHTTNSRLGTFCHATALVPHIIASKMGYEINRGDSEALR
jgi:hypothetical protein